MVTGFDIWGHDSGLRSHWKNRFAAFAVDAAIAFIPTSLALYFLDISHVFEVGIVTSVVFYLSATVPENIAGVTLGKKMFHLKVHPEAGENLSGRPCIRNLDRLFWFILPPLNFAIGMAIRGDPRMTALDRVAGTKVVHREETQRYEGSTRPIRMDDTPVQNPKIDDVCTQCGGRLLLLPDTKLQCEKCGLIQ